MNTRDKDLSSFDNGLIIGLHEDGKTTRDINKETGIGYRAI